MNAPGLPPSGPAAASLTPSPAGALPAKLSTFEDCVQLIATATAASDINVKDAALRQIETFFKSRIAKKSSENERDGSAAVKRAIMSSRSPAGAGTVASDKLPDS